MITKIAVNGASGRMGSRILALAAQSKEFKVHAAFETAVSSAKGAEVLPGVKLQLLNEQNLKGADALIDFSSPEGTAHALAAAIASKTGLVIGTTGLGTELEDKIKAAASKIAVVYAPNMSLGANLLFELAALASGKLPKGYDIEITEAHHRLKKDAPSGTAKKLAQVIADARGWDLKKVARYGREGMTGERPADQLGIHVIRAGEIVGDHTVILSGPGETIEITHRAHSRDAFARGSLVAAAFLNGKKSGLFSMKDVLGV